MKTTDVRRRLRTRPLIAVAIVAVAASLSACGPDEETTSLAGTYTLDRDDYLRGVMAEAEAWAAKAGDERSKDEQASMLAEARDKARRRAEGAMFRLELAAEGTFQLDIQNEGEPLIIGRGSWRREATRLILETEDIEIDIEPPEDVPEEPPMPPGTPPPPPPPTPPLPPPLEAEIVGDVLIVQPGEGVPFKHRLVRAKAK